MFGRRRNYRTLNFYVFFGILLNKRTSRKKKRRRNYCHCFALACLRKISRSLFFNRERINREEEKTSKN